MLFCLKMRKNNLSIWVVNDAVKLCVNEIFGNQKKVYNLKVFSNVSKILQLNVIYQNAIFLTNWKKLDTNFQKHEFYGGCLELLAFIRLLQWFHTKSSQPGFPNPVSPPSKLFQMGGSPGWNLLARGSWFLRVSALYHQLAHSRISHLSLDL